MGHPHSVGTLTVTDNFVYYDQQAVGFVHEKRTTVFALRPTKGWRVAEKTTVRRQRVRGIWSNRWRRTYWRDRTWVPA